MSEISVARPSSTVVLVRDATDAPELFLVRRHERSSFGSAYAFPGGVVDASDRDTWPACSGLSPAEADGRLGTDGALDFYVAAIRELFEETGVLLGHQGVGAPELQAARDALNAGELDWNRFIAECGVTMACDRLRYFSHWITPEVKRRRYATRFFVARMPDGQTAAHDEGELTDSLWTSAAAALAAGEGGSMALHFPTIRTLHELAPHGSVDELLHWAADREAAGVTTILPVIRERDGENVPVIEENDGP